MTTMNCFYHTFKGWAACEEVGAMAQWNVTAGRSLCRLSTTNLFWLTCGDKIITYKVFSISPLWDRVA